MIRKKMALLISSSALLVVTMLAAAALAQGTFETMGCTWQYTYCSDIHCPDGPGAWGQHVYECTTYPFVRPVDTCCSG